MARGLYYPSGMGPCEYGGRAYGRSPLASALDLATGGTFTRSTEGSYLTAAPNSGSSAFLAWATTNTRRVGYLGLLLEGSRTNYVRWSRDPGNAVWTANGTLTLTAGNGPDATLVAARNQTAAGGRGTHQQSVPIPAGLVAGSAWARRMPGAGAGTAQVFIDSAGTGDLTVVAAIDETFSRPNGSTTISIANPWWNPWSGLAIGGGSAIAVDYLADLHQLEPGAFATSAIRTTTTAVTRGADVLSYVQGQYPVGLLTTGGITRSAPICSSAQLIAHNAEMVIAAISTTDYVAFYIDGGAAKIRIVQGGVQRVISGALTWSADQVLTVTWRPSAGELVVAGASSGDGAFTGTSAAWSSGTLYVGSLSDGSKPIFAHFTDSRIDAA